MKKFLLFLLLCVFLFFFIPFYSSADGRTRAAVIGIIVISLVLWFIVKSVASRKETFSDKAKEKPAAIQKKPEPSKPAPVSASEKKAEEKKESVFPASYSAPSFNRSIDGYMKSYQYPDVSFIPVSGGHAFANPSDAIVFETDGKDVSLLQNEHKIGSMRNNRLSGMVVEWIEKELPVRAYVVHYAPDDSSAMMAMAFYQDFLEKFKNDNPDHLIVKLAGKADEFMTEIPPGESCSIHYDYDLDKYEVSFGPFLLGYLPAAAMKFAEEQEVNPDSLCAVFAFSEETDTRTRYSVCIAPDD